MYLIKVKETNKKSQDEYFVEAINMTDAEAILTSELKEEFKIVSSSVKSYNSIVTLVENGDYFYEVVFEFESVDGKMLKDRELIIVDYGKDALNYCMQKDSNVELLSFKKLNVLEILKKEE